MFQYYLGVAVFCIIAAVLSLCLATTPAPLAVIFVGLACSFITIGFITSGPQSRW